MFFDTHAHLDDERFANDRELVIERAREAGVGLIMNIGYDVRHAQNTVLLTREYEHIYGSVGVHPHEAKHFDEKDLKSFTGWLLSPR